jgi:zinc protease
VVQTQAQRPFLAIAPVQADQTAASMQEIKREIEEFVGARSATEAEVATSKRRSTLTLPGRWETARAVARDIAELVRFDLPDDYWNGYAELVGALAAADVSSAAKRLLHPDRLTWVVVGDRSVIEQSVRALAFGEVHVVDTDGSPVGP